MASDAGNFEAEVTEKAPDERHSSFARAPHSVDPAADERKQWFKNRPAKRAFDIVAASLLLFLIAPVLAAIALLVALDGGPIFYLHRRIGRRGRTFNCIKFRTMRVDSEGLLADLLSANSGLRSEWDSARKLRNDPRVTPIGRTLRRASLDELPQLINVLKGEMSLVGPRPVTADELHRYYEGAPGILYLSVRPGITGLWQVSGRSDTSYAHRVALDCSYVVNMSMLRDLRLLVRTVGVLTRRTGAY